MTASKQNAAPAPPKRKAKPPAAKTASAAVPPAAPATPPADSGNGDGAGLYLCIQNVRFKIGDKARFDRNPDPKSFRRIDE